jgi:hypothetical protein
MRFGLYGEWRGCTYVAAKLPEGGFKLISDRQTPGFRRTEYGNYVHEVERVERLYTVNCRVRYGGEWFCASPVRSGVLIATSDAGLARKLGFRQAERGEWEKTIPESDVEGVKEEIREVPVK